MMNATWNAYVTSWLFENGTNEDGETNSETAFFVVVENARGDRFASKMAYTTVHMHFQVAEEKAAAFLARVQVALAAGADPTASPKWSPWLAVYGSEAYVEYGQAEEVAWEKGCDGRR